MKTATSRGDQRLGARVAVDIMSIIGREDLGSCDPWVQPMIESLCDATPVIHFFSFRRFPIPGPMAPPIRIGIGGPSRGENR